MDNNYKETILLLKYMVKHNQSHTSELKDLFLRVEDIDDSLTNLFNDAVKDYENGTEKLESILKKLEEKKAK